MSLLKRIESARPGASGAPSAPSEPGSNLPSAPAGGPPSAPTPGRLTSQAPVRESFRDVKFRIQNRVIQDLDPKLDLSNQVKVPRQVYIERSGKLELTNVVFQNDDHVMRIIDRIIAPIGRRVDESSPMVDARLTDGSRVNAIIPPLSLVGPVITIRKFSASPFTVEDLIRF